MELMIEKSLTAEKIDAGCVYVPLATFVKSVATIEELETV